MRFTRTSVENAGQDWSRIETINNALDALANQKVSEIHVEGPLLKSKIAWKFASLRQAFIYRVVDICEGAIASWESGNMLAALILGRAALETAAVLHALVSETEKALAERNLSALDKIVMTLAFGAKSSFWKLAPELEARNVLTIIQRLDKSVIPGILHSYESLCEITHPNSQGQHQFYAETDKENIIVKLSRNKERRLHIVQLTPALLSGVWAEELLSKLELLIEKIGTLHEEIEKAQT